MYHHEVRRRGGRNAADAEQKRSALSAMLFAGITVSNLSLSSWSFLAAGISRSLRPAPNSRRGYARHSRDIVAPREYTGCSVIGGARWARGQSICRNNFFSSTREKERGGGEGERSQPLGLGCNQGLKAGCNLNDDGSIDAGGSGRMIPFIASPPMIIAMIG